MSQSSFPRREHISALQKALEHIGIEADVPWKVEEAGLDRYRCKYRLTLSCPGLGWSEEISVHFQLAERILNVGAGDELTRQVTGTIERCKNAYRSRSK